MPQKKKTKSNRDDIKAYLSKRTKSVLVEMIMAQSAADVRFHEQLLMEAAGSRPDGIDVDAFCSAVDNAVYIDEYVEYSEMWAYTERIDKVVESIGDLLDRGHAGAVIEITEHALKAVTDSLQDTDDSSGSMGMILADLQRIHIKACVAVKPDPVALARRLFAWELSTDGDTFYGAAKTYSRVLGKEGLAEYRRLAEEEWKTVPDSTPNRDSSSRFDYRRSRITDIMRSLAQNRRDVEALVAIERHDLSSSYRFLKVAEIYQQAKKYDKAIDWAKRGIDAFGDKTDSRLRELLADEYHRLKRHDDAMKQIWVCFERSPSLEWFKKLSTHAEKSGEWPVWRGKALRWIRSEIARKKRVENKIGWGRLRPFDHSLLVEIFLWEKDEEAAWNEAKKGGCSDALWMKLAATREKNHTRDAVEIYKKQIETIVAGKNQAAYDEATKLIERIRSLMKKLGEGDAFADYLADVRACHKPKRNFMKSLDRAKLR